MNITKELEGSIIFATPRGNAARGCAGDVYEFKVIKVKRKYVEMLRLPYGQPNNYCPKSGATQLQINAGYGSNSGYRFFPSRQAIVDHKLHIEKLGAVKDYFGRYGQCELSPDKVSQIHSIITADKT